MKKCIIILTAILALEAKSSAEEKNLPTDSIELLSKLNAFEEEENAKARLAIQQKRDAVSGVLEAHMKRETLAGNLEGAIALKNKIAELSESQQIDSSDVETEAHPSGNNSKLESLFVGYTWGVTIHPYEFVFNEGGEGVKLHNGKRFRDFKWKIVESEVVQTFDGFEYEYFWFDSARKGEKVRGGTEPVSQPTRANGAHPIERRDKANKAE